MLPSPSHSNARHLAVAALAACAMLAPAVLTVPSAIAAPRVVAHSSYSLTGHTKPRRHHKSNPRKPEHSGRKKRAGASSKPPKTATTTTTHTTTTTPTTPVAPTTTHTSTTPTITPTTPTTTSAAPPLSTLPTSGSDPLTTIGVTTTAETATNPSGAAMPVGNLPGWNQVFSDDFTTSVPVGGFSNCTLGSSIMDSDCSGLPASVESQLWAYPDGWTDTSGNGRYTPSQVLSIHNNMLDYYLHTSSGIHEVAAVVPKIPGGPTGNGLQYGAYAIRFKTDTISSYKTAFLLWPDSENWPADGEIDFPEGNLDSTMSAYMHQEGATSGSQQDAYNTSDTYASWHTAVIEWTPTTCEFILDGQVIGTSISLIPNTPMHWVLQAETALSGGAPADSISGHIYIAWIAAYAQATL
jgi:hypothetical protein